MLNAQAKVCLDLKNPIFGLKNTLLSDFCPLTVFPLKPPFWPKIQGFGRF